jgi:Cobalamin-independent synthase, Catalytic domain
MGSLPGTDIAEATRVVLGELPDLPHIPELPGRGPGSDLVGRGAALLTELPVEIYAARWRVASRPGVDLRVARDFLKRDLDVLTEQASEYQGVFKVQAVGPWTLATMLNLQAGGVMLRDPGATRDLVASLAEGVRTHLTELRGRLPRAKILLQLDEPALPVVLAGRVRTESGLGVIRPVDPAVARAGLAAIVGACADGVGADGVSPVVVHCCAAGTPFELIRESGAGAVAVDLGTVTSGADLDGLGAVLDAGLGLFAGVVDTSTGVDAGVQLVEADIASRVQTLWHQLGFPAAGLAAQVVLSPACGLAGARPERVRAVLGACRGAARRLTEIS